MGFYLQNTNSLGVRVQQGNQALSCLLLFYVLAKFKVISGRVLPCDSVHSWQLYSAVPLGNQAISTIT